MTESNDESLRQRLDAAMAQVNRVLLGKPRQVKLAFTKSSASLFLPASSNSRIFGKTL